ncbi:hypothetical protein [Myxococcus sp. RHSTA-1-4]|uniref:hypothetical protein n=1 Tax=Myxococcus sp. RHSTA-1-4 TaxID=2874601 RepID=UPI001CC0829F|nr:hypothetical protein [Myxococcus sp. RHSTA-1-4]MBZ4422075.1 hypothetical protein [Myxococcus sp. RHSTA-1-4]
MRARMAFLAAAVLLSACTEGKAPLAPVPVDDPSTDPGSPTPEEAVVVVQPPAPVTGSAVVVGLEEGARGLASVSQVDVDLTVRGVRGRGTVEVEFVPPSGLPYERRSSVVEARPDESRTVRFSLPVAGTTVTTSGMSGTWQARFFLDGAPLTTAAFTLEP